MTYQSLYRRYRSQTFGELKGQDHISTALRNAVREGRVGHAYLFSGPRGTGKTSTARILAKALNCENPLDGEPDGTCESCLAVAAGVPVDWLVELDAASNNKVDDMRELLERVAWGTSGKRKVYILDEVHMLGPGAEAALLKTLEEPPEHVVFVLATTDPQKVRDTIKSRTQHFDFHLLPADVMAEHIRWVIGDAGLGLGDDAVEHVVRVGGGSARDTLSALEQVVALGAVPDEQVPVDAVLDALCDRATGQVLVAVAEAVSAGRDVRKLGEAIIARLRNAFLASMGAGDAQMSEAEREQAHALADRLGAPGITRALEVIGDAFVEINRKPDPRIVLEVALVRLTRADVDRSMDAVLERLDRLERAAQGGPPPSTGAAAPAAVGDRPAGPAAAARAELAAHGTPPGPLAGRAPAKKAAPLAQPPKAAAKDATPSPVAPAAPSGALPSRDELTLAWGDSVLSGLPGGSRALFSLGRFVDADGAAAVFALPNAPHRDHCEKKRPEIEAALARHFGRPVPLRLIVDDAAPTVVAAAAAAAPRPAPEPEEAIDVTDLVDAPSGMASPVDRLAEAFPGAELVDGD